jgi:drug/metabolite transporter (DMT)-like permease
MSDHLKGLLITVAGIIALSPDSLLVRLIDTDQWTLIFWRGIISGIGIGLLSACFHGRNTPTAFRRVGRPGILLSMVFTASTLFFITALHHTSVANTLVLAGTAPIFAAIMSRVFLAEHVHLRTWITIFLVVGAVGVIISESYGGGNIWGDMSALACAVMMGATFVIMRQSKGHDMTPAMALSGFVTALVVFPLALPFEISSSDAVLILALGLVISVAFGLLTIGPRYITAPEVSMLMPLETVVGTFLVWVFLNELPSVQAVGGGAVIILALSIHSAFAIRNQ